MFCQECGTKNEDSSIFCEECGTKLDKPVTSGIQNIMGTTKSPLGHGAGMQQIYSTPQSILTAPKKPMTKKTKIILGIAVAVIILIVGTYNIVKSQCSAEKAAETYFKNVMNAKWDNVYEDLYLAKSAFINKDQFTEVHKHQTKRKLYTYQVGPAIRNQEVLCTEIVITYQTSENLQQQYHVVLSKQAKKRFLFFDTWKVNPSEYILENYNIQVPNNTKVTFGGVELGTNYKQNSDDYYTYYTLPKVLRGTYDIKVTQENMNDVKTTVITQDGPYYLESMSLNEKIKTELVSKAQEALQKIYQAGLTKADFNTIADLFSSDESNRSNASNSYQSFASTLHRDVFDLQSVKLYNFSGEASMVAYDNDWGVNVDLNYSYDITYKYPDNWDGQVVSNTNSSNAVSKFTYILENGNWVLKYAGFEFVF